MNCQRCHGTGLVRNDNLILSFCDCPIGRVVWDSALARALDDVTAELVQP